MILSLLDSIFDTTLMAIRTSMSSLSLNVSIWLFFSYLTASVAPPFPEGFVLSNLLSKFESSVSGFTENFLKIFYGLDFLISSITPS